MLPFRSKIIHVRWSGESAWIPLGDLETGLGFENHTSHPAPGHVLLYPGGFSETEILFPYGGTCFSSIVGQLAGNHFLTVTEGAEQLRELGRMVLWEGARTCCSRRRAPHAGDQPTARCGPHSQTPPHGLGWPNLECRETGRSRMRKFGWLRVSRSWWPRSRSSSPAAAATTTSRAVRRRRRATLRPRTPSRVVT